MQLGRLDHYQVVKSLLDLRAETEQTKGFLFCLDLKSTD